MIRPEARFLPWACRPNGAGALDPGLSEALRLRREDVELAALFTARQEFDTEIARKLGEVRPPPEMPEQMAGAVG